MKNDEVFISTASRAIPLDQWAGSADLFDNPTPIGKKLQMISKLFSQEWLNPNLEYDIDESPKLDAKGMKELFESEMYNYCQTMLGIDCNKGTLKGN